MIRYRYLLVFPAFFSVSLQLADAATVEADLNRIPQGATSNQVITLVGAPIETIERETKRQKVWYYPSGSVVFIGGRARSVYLKGSEHDKFREEEQKKMESHAAAAAHAKGPSPVEDILSEILREVPSEAGGDSELKSLEVQR